MRILTFALLLISTFVFMGCADDGASSTSSENVACGIEEAPTTAEECECVGGVVRYDIGDGSTRCADDETLLTYLPIGIEPVLCCR